MNIVLYIISYKTMYTFIHEKYLLLLYVSIIYKNICCYYISFYIMKNKYSLLYETIYNRKYTFSCITEMFVVIIHRLV